MSAAPEVLVIGAGYAGLGAARRLRALGHRVLVLEAGQRPGGRAFTDAAGLDHGASWLHVAEVNPLTPIARELGFTIHEEPRRRRDLLLVGDRRATAAEQAAHDAACDAFDAAAEARFAQGGPDIPLAEAIPARGTWAATARHWYGTVICGVEPERNSLADYVLTGLDGANYQLREGLGALATRLAAGVPIRFGAQVAEIAHGPAGVSLSGGFGTLAAAAAIVTVSTGVLAAGQLRFTPALPAAVTAAIAGLPLGLLSKVALHASGPDRLGLPSFARLGRQVAAAGDRPMSFHLWPFGRPMAVGFLGGAWAWELARAGPAAAEAAARAELARYFGAATVARTFDAGATVTRWAEDPRFLGAYSHARVGAAGARATLAAAAPAGGRLRFAGEACHLRYAGTVGGAWDSGIAAAEAVSRTLRPGPGGGPGGGPRGGPGGGEPPAASPPAAL